MKDKKIITSGKKIITILLFMLLIPYSLSAKDKIVFGLTGTVYKGDLKIFDNWKKYLEKKLNIPVELKFSRTYSEMMSMINLGEVDIAYVCNTTYVQLKKQESAKLLSIPVSNGLEVYYSYIISKKSAPYKSLLDFKDKIFAFTDPGSNSGTVAPTYELLKNGHKTKDYFRRTIYTYEHGESIKAVLDEFVDGASVDSLVYEQFVKRHAKESKELKVVERLGPFTMSPIVANKNLSPKNFDLIQKIFVNMDKDKKGTKILKELSLDKLNIPKNKSYEDIEKIMSFIDSYE